MRFNDVLNFDNTNPRNAVILPSPTEIYMEDFSGP